MFIPKWESYNALPAQTNVKVTRIWIRYKLQLVTTGGDPIADWTMSAYGKTPTAFMQSDQAAVNLAAVMHCGTPAPTSPAVYPGAGVQAWLQDRLGSGQGGDVMRYTIIRGLLAGGVICLASGCVTSTVDQMVFNKPTEGIGNATVVILGRRHASDYDTEPDFVECVGDHIASGDRISTSSANWSSSTTSTLV